MKRKIFLFFLTVCLRGFTYSQAPDSSAISMEEKKIELGRVKGIRITVVKVKNPKAAINQSVLRVEYLPKKNYVSEVKIDLPDTSEINAFVKTIKAMEAYIHTPVGEELSEITFNGPMGMMAQCHSIHKVSPGSSGSSSAATNQKFYVTTTNKLHEGKTVYTDDKGTFIWRHVVATPGVTTPGTNGIWITSIQLQNNVPYSKIILTSDELRILIQYLELAKPKMLTEK